MIDHPLVGRQRVDYISGERVLRTKAVVDGDHDGLAGLGQHCAERVVGIEIADHPAALMEEHDGVSTARGPGRVVEADRQLTGGAWNRSVLHRHRRDRVS